MAGVRELVPVGAVDVHLRDLCGSLRRSELAELECDLPAVRREHGREVLFVAGGVREAAQMRAAHVDHEDIRVEAAGEDDLPSVR